MISVRRPFFLLSLLFASVARGQSYTFTHLAGSTGGMGFEDGPGSVARFDSPTGIAADGAGVFFVADLSGTIRRIVRATGEVTTFAGNGGFGLVDGPGHLASFGWLEGLVRVGGTLYVAESLGVRKIDLTTRAVSTVCPFPGASGISADATGRLWVSGSSGVARIDPVSGKATQVSQQGARDVAFDGNHTVYFASGHAIYAIDTTTLQVTIAAGSPSSFGNGDGPAATARFYNPLGLLVDATGALFITTEANTIRMLYQGTVSTLAGIFWFSGAADGVGSAARFFRPTKMTIDETGSLLVADSHNGTVRLVDRVTGSVTTISGRPSQAGYVDDTGTAARFSSPDSVALDSGGSLYIGDTENHVIRRIDPAGNVTTLAGLAGTSGSADGSGAGARFFRPRGVALDGAGSLYVADAGNHTIRKISLANGEVTTPAGSPGVPWLTDGIGTSAGFGFPTALSADGQGMLWIADCEEEPGHYCSLRRLELATFEVKTWAGGFDGPGLAAGADAVYLSEGGRRYIVRIDKVTKALKRLTGTGQYGAADGAPNVATFSRPGGMAFDGNGRLLVLDEGAGTLRRVDLTTGWVSTLAGKAFDWQNTDGTAGFARFANPRGLARAADGTLHVVDNFSHDVRTGRPALDDRATVDVWTGPLGVARTLDVSPSTSTSWYWEIVTRPTGSVAALSDSGARNPTFTPDVAGRFVFRVKATGATGMSITTVPFAAGDPFPAPTASIRARDASLCAGNETYLFGDLTGTPPWHIVFSDGYAMDSSFGSISRPVVPSQTTTYSVVEISDAFRSGSGIASATITVNPRPDAPSITAPVRVVTGATGLIATVPAHAGSTYSWSIESPASISSGANTNTMTFETPYAGTFKLSVREYSSAGCVGAISELGVNVVDHLPAVKFYLLSPCRILDTREASWPLRSQEARTLDVAGICGIPAEAKALVANITAVNPSSSGFLSAYPTGMFVGWSTVRTTAVSFRAGFTRAGSGTWPLGLGEPGHPSLTIDQQAPGETHVLVDVTGYYK
ncbi:MAG: hypothetical protein ABIT01_07150 [Thermoanaerobaculia bacterium]